MSFASVVMPDGRSWIPKFVKAINKDKCIGCGRCFKVCGRDVLQLMGMDDEGLQPCCSPALMSSGPNLASAQRRSGARTDGLSDWSFRMA